MSVLLYVHAVRSSHVDINAMQTRHTNSSLFCHVYVVVNFLSQVIFVCLLFFGMVIYANEVETNEKQKLPEIKN